VNLAVRYIQQEHVRRDLSFCGMRFTEDQIRYYRALREKIENDEAHVFHPLELQAPRASGKTVVLLKLAQQYDIPLIEMNAQFARQLSRSYPGVRVIGASETHRLRGSHFRRFLVDEGVSLERLDPSLRIITGINGRNLYYGN